MKISARKVACAAACAGLTGVATVRVLRPWFMNWGATDAEVQGPWPVDELVPFARVVATRAITIHAAPEEVWPWLMQLGQDRGGFYSYDWLENLIGADIHNLDRIEATYQKRRVGDTVWLARPDKVKGLAIQKVAMLVPNRVLALVSSQSALSLKEGLGAEGAWCFLLKPRDDGGTRLIMRTLGDHAANLGMDLVHFLMERKMMLGIKARAEKHRGEPLPWAEPVEEPAKPVTV